MAAAEPLNPYTILGLSATATVLDIKRAYFQLVRLHSPESDPAGFQRIRAAYDALRTPSARAATDRSLVHPPPDDLIPRRTPPLDLRFHPQDRWFEAHLHSDLERTDFQADFRPLPDSGLGDVEI